MVAAKAYLVQQLVKEFDVRWPQLANYTCMLESDSYSCCFLPITIITVSHYIIRALLFARQFYRVVAKATVRKNIPTIYYTQWGFTFHDWVGF